MAKLYFYYSVMNAGKSTMLLQSNYNYQERGMQTLILTPELDSRFGRGRIASRIGLQADATSFTQADDLLQLASRQYQRTPFHCVLLDEAQFLTRRQVRQLSDVCDQLDVPVLAYGIRTDFLGNLFEGSMELLAWADSLVEIKTICHCGRKATFQLRLDADGQPVKSGSQVQIGGNERYVSVCRAHFKAGLATRTSSDLPFED
ncbi:MAG: thymidine kinase [Pirellulaceae bacterium]|nr:thymidine kinase [Pirellulaceae bacterium]